MAALLSSKVKMGVAAGAGAILLVLALLGGVVGWIHTGEDTTPPQVEYPQGAILHWYSKYPLVTVIANGRAVLWKKVSEKYYFKFYAKFYIL